MQKKTYASIFLGIVFIFLVLVVARWSHQWSDSNAVKVTKVKSLNVKAKPSPRIESKVSAKLQKAKEHMATDPFNAPYEED